MNVSLQLDRETVALQPKQRLAIFLPTMHDGGAERMMLNLLIGIADRGYTIDLVLANAEGPHLVNVPKSIRLIDLKAPRVVTSLPGLIRYLREVRPHAILSIMNHANIVALLAQRLSGIPTRVLVSERNTLSISAQHARTWRAQFMPWLVRIFYPLANEIVTVSNGVADDLACIMTIPRQTIKVIYNPVVTPELRQKVIAPLDHPWFKLGQPPVILGVGRLTQQKDFATLIQAFAWVLRTHQARLVILGEGPERSALETLVKRLDLEQVVNLPGFVANPYVYMSRASLFVLSSKWEGLPGVLIEAMYCGLLLVSTDCPSGPREILGHGRLGQLVPVGDVSEMARAIELALDGKVARPPKDAWYPFELEKVVDEYLNLLLGDLNA
jgi:glycosyltransferase involved in cell wall biosynthesis